VVAHVVGGDARRGARAEDAAQLDAGVASTGPRARARAAGDSGADPRGARRVPPDVDVAAAGRAAAVPAGAAPATFFASAFASAFVSVPASISIVMSTLPTGQSCPSANMRLPTRPARGAGISTVALSVMISTMGWSMRSGSPSLTSQRTTSPSTTPSPMSGSLNS
jgi:hypothetical protein